MSLTRIFRWAYHTELKISSNESTKSTERIKILGGCLIVFCNEEFS